MKIVIVGGGAGGLELASKLGKKLGKKAKAEVVLIDRKPTHIWKPLLHEVAAGSLDAAVDAVSYRAHAYQHGFSFKLGTLQGVDRQRQCIQLAAVTDNSDLTSEEVLPAREESYDYLVLAIGSISNDFATPGVAEHCRFLDAPEQAIRFHDKLVSRFIRLNRKLAEGEDQRLHIAIVGGGATGVELSAELLKAREWFATYGLNKLQSHHLTISLIEAGPRLLPALRPEISESVLTELNKRGVDIKLNTQVARAETGALITNDEQRIDADLMVWAAGVKAPEFLQQIDGLSCNRAGQLLVEPTLQVQGDKNIFAIGDCAGFLLATDTLDDGSERQRWVPPRAQSAHQMASTAATNLLALYADKPLISYRYRDYGSLVSLSGYTAFGTLMGGLTGGSLKVKGRIARLTYVSLYRMHQFAIHGWLRVILLTLTDNINRFLRPRLKVH
ncbi:NAD(P)/FAD-dependent oxidoreductase [Oceanicoccus sp. KOV_DT_Chl]|uniref:NAD(P)/FAD-dependent oxidoreductase n=1 Tax=Oceanicoccus sp. KOV_DT_Chl TaxID=1904639 RepID=UPI000C7CE5D4|nr:NAD(P)/FAD-dependent oxidoreductase [Oceanicoccus sp. KOV_DT_Chl]